MNPLWSQIASSLDDYREETALINVEGQRISYRELSQQISEASSVIQSFQRELNAVGLFCRKGFPVIAHILASLKNNVTYIPLDIESPIERIEMIIEDSGLDSMVIDKVIGNEVIQSLTSMGFIKAHETEEIEWWLNPDGLKNKADIAYILFTSGSTGRPKGVEITHDNALVFIEWSAHKFALKHRDVVSSIAPLHFDLSIFDIYASLTKGASILLFNKKSIKNPLLLVKRMQEERVTVVYTTPTVLQLMVRYGKWARKTYPELRTILFAGEPYPIDQWCALNDIWPKVIMYNLYGPTETNVVTYYEMDRESLSSLQTIPIGIPCPYADWRLSELVETKTDATKRGVLWIRGQSVAKGYSGNQKETDIAFVRGNDSIWYNTGDVVEVDQDGVMFYCGRIDRMTKRNGYRIELGEIESAARSLDEIEDAVAVALTNVNQVKIRLFVVLHSGELNEAQLRSGILQKLPMYMLPDDFESIPTIPMTSNHKVDYRLLMKY